VVVGGGVWGGGGGGGERERERERRHCVYHSDHLNASEMKIMTANLLIACVTSDKRKDTAANDTTSLAGNLPLYPLQMTHR